MKEALTWEGRENRGKFSWSVYEKRVLALSKYITQNDKSVMDMGAGAMFLKTLLPENIAYYPVDYKSRCDDTIVCDFNNKEFPDIHADVAFCSGVLEYINDREWFLTQIANHVRKIIISYDDTGYISEILSKKGFVLSGFQTPGVRQPLHCFIKSLPNDERCTGCGACKNICPVDAIEMRENNEGFFMPHINEKCVHCHKCTDICPVYNIEKKNDAKPKIYAARADDDIRAVSSSGGIFSIMAENLFKKGGYVCGAAFDDDFVLRHVLVSSSDSMDGLRGSKYLQSDTGLIYRDVKEKLDSSKPVLFTGCPCQVAGLYAYLGKDYDNLYTVDLLCHGVPSQKLFSKYLQETSGGKSVKSVQFRPKKYGWQPGPLIVTYQDGSTLEAAFTAQNSYGWGFIHHLFDRKSCSYCPFQEFPRHGDISIADFWGIQKIDLSQTDGKGTSMVFVNNEKGETFYCEMSERLISSARIDINHDKIPNQIKANRPVHKLRDRFLSLTACNSFESSMEKVFSKRFHVGQVCNYKAGNFGGSLTQYALYHVLEDMGFSTLMIERPLNTKGIKRASTALDRLYIKNPYPQYALSPQFKDKEAMRELNSQCDIFVVGSDQLFQYSLFVEMGQFVTLDWAEDSKKKIAYAASFGHGHIWGEQDILDQMAYFIKKFDAFSVREKGGAVIAENEFGVNAELVFDPVFLCDRKHYDSLIDVAKRESPAHYVGSYILDPSEDNRNIILKTMKTLSLPCEVVSELSHNERYEAPLGNLNVVHLTIEERLKSIANCDFFVTDSFHGTCFSIIMKKPFIAIKNNKRGGDRFDSLLTLLDLQDRLIESFSDLEKRPDLFEPIDYTKVYQILDKEIKRSKKWFYNVLTFPVKKTISDYDMMCRLLTAQNKRIDELTKQVSLLTSPMKATDDIFEYMDILCKTVKHNIIFIAVKDTPGTALNDTIAEKLMKLGLKVSLKDKHWHSYIAIIEDGNVFFETISAGSEPSSICVSLSGMTVEITSKVFQNGNEAKIILNGKDHSINKRGLNIVVYNKQLRLVTDSVAFDTHSKELTCTRAQNRK